jgi:hypothetical protein
MEAAVYIGNHFSVSTLADHDGRGKSAEPPGVTHRDEYALMPDGRNHFLTAFKTVYNHLFVLLIDHCDSHERQVQANDIMGKGDESEFYGKARQLFNHSIPCRHTAVTGKPFM